MEPIEITGLAGWVALGLPIAALLTVVILALARRRDRSSASTSGRYGEVLDEKKAPPAAPQEDAAQPAPADVSRILDAIRGAEAAKNEKALAGHYLALARVRLHEGAEDEATGLLDKSLTLAVRHDLKAEHAGVRIELGDLAERAGDLTSACEHWQLARALFDELNEADRAQAAQDKMQATGCPTDWVLNDF